MFDFSSLFRRTQTSGEIAKQRLKLVLINDRSGLTPAMLESLRAEITKVISRYLVIDENSLDIRMTNVKSEDGKTMSPALIANIPIKKVKKTQPTGAS